MTTIRLATAALVSLIALGMGFALIWPVVSEWWGRR